MIASLHLYEDPSPQCDPFRYIICNIGNMIVEIKFYTKNVKLTAHGPHAVAINIFFRPANITVYKKTF